MSSRAHLLSSLSPRLAAALIGLMALVWVVMTLVASRGNSATFDEPVHTASAIAIVHGDYSANPEHPPLWKYVAGLPHLGKPEIDISFEQMASVRADPIQQWPWTVHALYREGTRNGDADVRRSQYAMTFFGVALLLTAAGLAWWLAGPLPAVLTAAVLVVDPTLLAHGPIVSNDVAVSLMLLAVVFVSVRVARGGPAYLSVLLGVLIGAAACTKYTGVIAIPLAAIVLLVESAVSGKLERLKPLLVALPCAYLSIWAIYGFRYAPSKDGALIDTQATALRVARLRQMAAGEPLSNPPPAPDGPTKVLLAVERLRLLPQPMTAGMLLSYGVTRSNPAYALGQFSMKGWWWYFPVAIALKTPLGLLALWGTAGVLAVRARQTFGVKPVVVCAGVLFFVAILTPLNIGVRHVLPVMVLLAPVTGVVLAAHWGLRWVRVLTVGCLVATVAELGAGWPDYLAFFNVPARLVGPEKLLGDSNLDWGQDLKRLGEWRKANPRGTLYLAYNGTSDPRSYGLVGPNLPTTWYFAGTQRPDPNDPDKLVAISATYLQIAPGDSSVPFFRQFQQAQPVARVGRSIWIYRIP